jgi:hypothetical protein
MLAGVSVAVSATAGAEGSATAAAEAVAVTKARMRPVRPALDEEVSGVMAFSKLMTPGSFATPNARSFVNPACLVAF